MGLCRFSTLHGRAQLFEVRKNQMIASELLGTVFVAMEGQDRLPVLVEVGSAEVVHPDEWWRIDGNCLQRSGYMGRERLGNKFQTEASALAAAKGINEAGKFTV